MYIGRQSFPPDTRAVFFEPDPEGSFQTNMVDIAYHNLNLLKYLWVLH